MVSRFLMFGLVVRAGSTAAIAAEPISVPLSTSASLPVYGETEFDWSGFYAGVSSGLQADNGGGALAFGAQIGVQTQFDFYLVGAEIAVRGLTGTTGDDFVGYGEILGRAGVVANDSLFVYTAAGYGLEIGATSDQLLLVGGGLEIPITDDVSLGAQYLRGVSVGGGEPTNLITFGANWHF